MLVSMKVLFQFRFSECISCFALGRFRFGEVLFIFCFSIVSTEDSNGCHNIDSSVLSFLWFTLESDVEVDGGSAREGLFTTRCLCLAG